MKPDFHDRVVLVTDGSRGIGLASALAFGRRGAHVVLTHSSGSADDGDITRNFADVGAHPPMIVCADMSQSAETTAVMERIGDSYASLDFLICNVSNNIPVERVADLTERSLLKSIQCGTWPVVDHLRQVRGKFGAYPRYAVALSSTSPDRFTTNGDLAATAGAALESLCRYLAHRLRDEGVRLNVVRTIGALTDSVGETLRPEAAQLFQGHLGKGRAVTADDVADTVVALCSGLLDGVHGQVITVDRGAGFADTVAQLHLEQVQE